MIGRNQPLYTIDRTITNIAEPFGDGEHIVYVNGADKNAATALGKLMHDFFCANPDEMYYPELADKTRYYKENAKGEKAMCRIMEDLAKEMEKDLTDKAQVQFAKDMLSEGDMPLEKIARLSRLTIQRVQELAAQKAVQ